MVSTAEQPTIDYNLYYNNSTDVFHEGDGEWAIGPNAVTADPQLANPGSGDFTLKSTSPAIDAGTTAEFATDYDGEPIKGFPDIGAFEYKSSPATILLPPKNFRLLD